MKVLGLMEMEEVSHAFELGYGAAWYAGLVAAAGLAAWQQFIARRDGAPGCFRAFLNNHWFGGAIFAGLLLEHWR